MTYSILLNNAHDQLKFLTLILSISCSKPAQTSNDMIAGEMADESLFFLLNACLNKINFEREQVKVKNLNNFFLTSFPPSRAFTFQALQCGGLPSLVSGSARTSKHYVLYTL